MNTDGVGLRLNELLANVGMGSLDEKTAGRFEDYVSLFVRWNKRLNLSSVRDKDDIISRHFIESIAVARALPPGIATLLDFGSGAGLPGIPVALCRSEIAVTLAESQGKKSAFLHEAARALGIRVKIHLGRAEALNELFDCVVLRAVDKMPKAVATAVQLVAPKGWLALMTTEARLPGLKNATWVGFGWTEPIRMPFSESRLLALGQRTGS